MTQSPTRIRFLLPVVPLILTLLLITFYLQETFTDTVPVWRDEIWYWHQIRTFQGVGFQGGYYTFEEIPANAPFTRFGAHGPAFITVFGLLARVTGWQLYTFPWYNLFMITAALGILVTVIPFSRAQSGILGILIATSAGLLFFLPSTMQEALHFAIAAVSAAILYWQLSHTQPMSPGWKALIISFFVLAGFFRLTWSLLLLPVLLLDARTQRGAVMAVIAALSIIAGQFLLFSYWAAPYPLNYSRILLRQFAENPLEALGLAFWYLGLNIRRIRIGHPVEIIQRYTLISLVIVLLIASMRARSRWLRRFMSWLQISRREAAVHVFNLGLIFLMQLVLYDVFSWRDYRVLAPHLFLSMLLFAALNRTRFVAFLMTVNIVCLLWFFPVYRDFASNEEGIYEGEWYGRYASLDALRTFEQAIAPHIVFDPNASNPWCNTLLTDDFYPQLATLPAGIGISMTIDPSKFDQPIRSRYLLFTPEQIGTFSLALRVERIVSTDIGDLYLNLDADCKSS